MTENKPFFNRDRFFTVNKRVLVDNEDTYYYWLKENDEKVNGWFYRLKDVCAKGRVYLKTKLV